MMKRSRKPLHIVRAQELGIRVHDLLPKTETREFRPYYQVRCLVDGTTGSATVEMIDGINGCSVHNAHRITLKDLMVLRENIDTMIAAEMSETTES